MRSSELVRGLVLLATSLLALGCGGEETEADLSQVGSQQEPLRGARSCDGLFIDLGVLEPDPLFGSGAYAINRRGTVVGTSNVHYSPELNPLRGFRWTADAGMVALDTLGGASSSAADINDREQIAGSAELADGSTHAAVWDAEGRVRDLGTLGGTSSSAYGINNRGQVIGLSDDPLGTLRPFIWDRGTGMVDLELPGRGFAYVNAINDAGVIAGALLQFDSSALPFKWTKQDGPTTLDMLGGSGGEAHDINDRGDVVGYAVQDGAVLPMKWTGSSASPVLLPTPADGTEAIPLAINDRGTMVGGATLLDGEMVAVQWPTASRVERLPLPSGFAVARDINARGQVVGAWNGRAFFWEPAKRGCRPH